MQGLLQHPLVIGAAAVLVVNDHIIKPHWPGLISGKLSDFVFCFLMPVFLFQCLLYLVAIGHRILGVAWHRTHVVLLRWAACVAAAVHFALLQLWPDFGVLHVRALMFLTGGNVGFSVTADPMDLLALVVIPLANSFLAHGVARAGNLPLPTASEADTAPLSSR